MNPTWERKLIAVDSSTHRRTRVDMRHGRQFGDSVHLVGVVPVEFPRLLAHYPLFFVKDTETGKFGLAAMLGFDGDENLVLDGEEWTVPYIPLHAQRGPFSVGPGVAPPGESATQLAAYLDANDPRVQEDEGEALFTNAGEPTEYLQRMNAILLELVRGTHQVAQMVDVLVEHDLLEPVAFQFEFFDGSKLRLDSLYPVHVENLAALKGDELQALHEKGYIRLMHEVIASVSHVGSLIEMKNERIRAAKSWASI